MGCVRHFGLHHDILDGLYNGCLFGRHKACPHVDPLSTHGKRCSQLDPCCSSSACDERNGQLLRSLRQEHPVSDVFLSWVATAVKTVHRNHVSTHLLCRQCVPHCHAFVDDEHASVLALFDHLLGVTPGCFDYLHLLLDQHLHDAIKVRRNSYGQQRDVHAKWLVSQLAAFPDLVSQSFFALWRLSYRQCCDDPQATGIRHSRSHVRIAHKVHPALNNGVLDAQCLGKLCLEHHFFTCKRSAASVAGVR
mmetsp:Transcript_122697/g.172800  ORF Transcript_122697/g.172800 Transcript_122697/m.172800 type:complete len:249 (+) Transcript_122697:452-1198(+)